MNQTLLLPALLELLAKSALLLLGAAALTAAARRLSAAQQHAILLTAFAALLLLPLTKCIAPRWHLPGSPGTPGVTALPAPPEIEIAAPTAGVVAAPPAKSFQLPDAPHLALFLWLAGIAAIIGYRLLGSMQIHGLRRRSVTADSPRLTTLARQAAAEMNLRTGCAIRLSTAARVPCTWGVRNPVVMLPATAEEWPDTRLLAALRHEFAHVVRRDYLARWLTLLTCALYWPNALVWLAARRLRLAQEQACDDLVLGAGTPPADYAALLVESACAALRSSGAGWRVAVAMARPSTLEGRVLAIVDEKRSRRPAGRALRATAALCLATVIGASALAQISPGKPATGPDADAPNQIRIVTKFLEMPTGALQHLNAPDEKISVVWSKPQADKNWQAFQNAKSVDVLAAPTVTVPSGRSAKIQLGREYDLPAGSPAPKKFLGTILEFKVTASATDIDLDTTVLRSALKEADTITAGKPVFDDQRNRVEFTVFDQSTIALRLGAAQREGREIWAWVEVSKVTPQNAAAQGGTATPELEPLPNVSVLGSEVSRLAAEGRLTVTTEGKPARETSAAAVRSTIEVTAKHGTFDQKTGAAVFSGDVQVNIARPGEAPVVLQADQLKATPAVEPKTVTVPPETLLELRAQPPDRAISASRMRAILGEDAAAPEENRPKQEPPVGDGKKARADVILTANESAALKKAEQIVIPRLETREAFLSEMLELLRKQSVEFDPEKKGVEIVLKPGTTSDARITVSLTNIPLIEALKYTAGLAGLKLRAEAGAIVIEP